MCCQPRQNRYRCKRRGTIMVLAAFLLIVFLGMLAFSIDLGYMCVVRVQAQNAADAAALAAAWEMIGEERLAGEFDDADANARSVAAEYAGYHRLAAGHAELLTSEDVQIGRLNNFADRSESMSSGDPLRYNSLRVTVHATAARGLETRHFFAPLFGHNAFDTSATATAAFGDRISGFRTSDVNPDTTLLPFTLHVDDWNAMLNGDDEDDEDDDDDWSGDDWRYDPEDGTVRPGSDGVPEIKMYPTSNGSGNFGTVDIGNDNNSTADLERQIREGVSDDDLENYDGVLALDSLTKSLMLNGDTGISAGIKHAVADVIGQPRSIPLYRSASGQGDTMNYEIVGFAGIRIVDVKLTGNSKYVTIQPAFVIDPTAISSSWATESDFVIQSVRLVR